MGMTLQIHILDDGGLSTDSDDHSLMHAWADELDGLCAELGVEKLSAYFDTTDLDYKLAQEVDEGGDAEAKADQPIDPVTGAPYGIDDMRWFDAEAGLVTLTALREALEEDDSLLETEPDENDELLAEIDDCIQVLEEAAADGSKFHLAVMM
jgi:hypothetical protein